LKKIGLGTEDHPIFQGEIEFLIQRYYDKDAGSFDLALFKNTWNVFKSLFIKSKGNDGMIVRTLLYYGITWFRDTPYYYKKLNSVATLKSATTFWEQIRILAAIDYYSDKKL
jgi:hypothetical protein